MKETIFSPVTHAITLKCLLFAAKVESIEAEALSATSARVTWEPVDVAEVTGYLVYYRPLVAVRLDLEGEEKVPKTDSSVVIRNLMSNVEYWFEVAAVVEVNGRTLTGERTGANTTVLIESKQKTTLGI